MMNDYQEGKRAALRVALYRDEVFLVPVDFIS